MDKNKYFQNFTNNQLFDLQSDLGYEVHLENSFLRKVITDLFGTFSPIHLLSLSLLLVNELTKRLKEQTIVALVSGKGSSAGDEVRIKILGNKESVEEFAKNYKDLKVKYWQNVIIIKEGEEIDLYNSEY